MAIICISDMRLLSVAPGLENLGRRLDCWIKSRIYPVQFDINAELTELKNLDEQMVTGASNREIQGPYHGKLSRLIGRLEAKRNDRRLAFLFQPPAECMEMNWLERMVHVISTGRAAQNDNSGGIKIIDFSEVPSDVLPLMVSLAVQIIFSASLWTQKDKRHPIVIMCDEHGILATGLLPIMNCYRLDIAEYRSGRRL